MAPTLSQIELAEADAGLRDRIKRAARSLDLPYADSAAEANMTRVLAVEIAGETSISAVYEYQWMLAVQTLGSKPASRRLLDQALRNVGLDPAGVTDAQIVEAVSKVLIPAKAEAAE